MKNLKWFSLMVLFFLGLLLNSGCQKEKNCDGERGVFIQKEGCGLVAKLENGILLEDTSFRLWNVKVNGSTSYCIKFEEHPNVTNSCMDVMAVEFLEVNEL